MASTRPQTAARGGSSPDESVLQEAEHRLERFDRDVMARDWALYTGSSGSRGGAVEQARARYLRALTARINGTRVSARAADNGAARRWELLDRELTDARTEQDPTVLRSRRALQKRIVAFRPRWQGRRVGRQVVRDVIRKDPDPQRRKRAFYAERPLFRTIEPELRQLIALRNARARDAGYRSFAELRLSFEGLAIPRLEQLLDSVLRAARQPIAEFREGFRESTGSDEWFPWDLSYALERRAALPDPSFPARTMTRTVLGALREWGFRTPQLRFRVVRHDLPFGGLTFPVRVPDDVRVLVHPRGGWESHLVLFHEFGHAVHARSVRQPTHLLRNGQGYAAYQEGIADLFEEVAFTPEWLRTRPGIDARAIDRFLAARRSEHLLRAAQTALGVFLELSLYRNPKRDPIAEHHRQARRTFGFGEYDPPSWANTLLVTHPVYTQSYFLSLLFRKQVVETLRETVGDRIWPNRRVGPWLTQQFFVQGAREDWLPLLREVTGRPLGVGAFLRSSSAN